MGNVNNVIWELEPHTKAKHEILRYYLGAWFPILATNHRRLLYVDGFAGPGEYKDGEEGSPIIALKVARDHPLKNKLHRPGMELVFIFIEKDKARYANLTQKVGALQLPSCFRIEKECDSFEHVFSSALAEIEQQSENLAPSFVFIDPFGPTGFPMALIKRIAKQRRSEVLITFNYQSLNQWFLQDSSKHKHLDELYGNDAWRKALNIPDPHEKEEFLRKTYQSALESLGWQVRPFQMINKHNQTQYYLFFATGYWRGMLVMKGAMWNAAPTGDFRYSDLSNPAQPYLLELEFNEQYSRQLANNIYQNYKGQSVSKQTLIQNDLSCDPVCIGRHLTKALKILENEDPPLITKVEGRQKRGAYPDRCLITFTP